MPGASVAGALTASASAVGAGAIFIMAPSTLDGTLLAPGTGGRTMPIFITQARLSQENVKNFVAHPEDRFAAVEKLVAAAGGKLLHYYATTGEYDVLLITEAPDGADAVIAGMAAA